MKLRIGGRLSLDCRELYFSIHENLYENLQKSFSSHYYMQITSANAFVEDYVLWIKCIEDNYGIEIFELAISEYRAAILFCLQSLYKQAFTALRSCLEHTMFGIQLSTNYFQYLSWKKSKKDVYWSEIINLDTGPFSSNYFSLFFPELCPASHLIFDLAKRVYCESSEYTHGNYIVWESTNGLGIYDERLLQKFFDSVESVNYIIEFSLFVRFIKEVPPDKISILESQINEYLGHFREVTDYLSFRNGE